MSVLRLFPRNHGSLREEFSPEGSDRKIRCFRPFPFICLGSDPLAAQGRPLASRQHRSLISRCGPRYPDSSVGVQSR